MTGPSMEPTLRNGDRLIGLRTSRVRPSDLVVFRDPTEHGRLLVKRVVEVHEGVVVVIGDNEQASRDSRSFGPVGFSDVVGIAHYRYWPSERAGVVSAKKGP